MNLRAFLIGLLLIFNVYSAKSQSKKMLVRTLTGVKLMDLTGPVPVIGPQIAGFGGGSAEEELNIITDVSNNILFMTACDNSNVINVFTSAYTQMPNGIIRGNASSLESAICKIPCTTDQFYFFNFFMDPATLRDSLFYSIIDMSLNGGLGAVTQKNIYLGSGFKEGMSISHQARNGCRWLLVSGYDSSNNFLVKEFKISNSGVTGPIILDTYPMAATINNPHELELSGDNLKMCVSTFSPSPTDADILLYDFDLESGTLSARQTLNVSTQIVLGVEFSPDATKIYYQTNTTNISTLGRYDITTATNQIIDNTRTRYQTDPELGGNGRIYIGGNYVENYISEIADPNNPNVANIQYTRNAYFVDAAGCRPGLTNTIDGEPPGTSNVPNQIDFTYLGLAGCNVFQFLDSTCLGTWFKWDFGDGQVSFDENPIHQFQNSGNYNVNLRVLICSDTLSITHTVNANFTIPTISTSPDATICNGASTQLTSNGALTYSWAPSSGLSSTTDSIVFATPATTTIYTVVGTFANGCTATSTITVTPFTANVSITPVGDTIVCAGNAVTLNGNGTTQYLWSTGSTASSIIATTSGMYYVQGFDNGCQAEDSISILINPIPNLTISNAPSVIICNGSSATIQASGANAYFWSPSLGLSSTTDSIVIANPLVTTTYTVTGTNQFGCSNTSTITAQPVIANVSITVTGDTVMCAGNTANLTANGTSQFLWSNGSTAQSLSVNSSGTYTVQGFENGCSDTASTIITVNPIPTLVLSVPPSIVTCNNTSATIEAFGASTYLWSPALGLNSTTDSIVVANPISATLYTVTGTNAFGCTSTSTVNVQPDYINASISSSGSTNLCDGDSIVLTAAGGQQYLWSSGETAASIIVSTTGSYFVFASNANCMDSTSINISLIPSPTISLAIQPSYQFCEGDSGLITLSSSTNVSKQWYLNSSLLAGQTTDSLYASTTGTYSVIAENTNGCTSEDSVFVNVVAQPLANFSAPVISCSAFVTFNNTSSNSNAYHWTFDTFSQSNFGSPTILFPDTGNYIISLIAQNSLCSDTITNSITIGNTPFAEFQFDTICGLARTFTNNSIGGTTYSWDFGDGDTSYSHAPMHVYDSQGKYTVKLFASDRNGCTDSLIKEISLLETVTADFIFSFDSCSRIISFLPGSTSANSYNWDFGDGTSDNKTYTQHIYQSSGEYEVSLITNFGTQCAEVSKVNLDIERTEEKHLYIPNTFTPNVDGLNELFEIVGIEICNEYKLVIFDRWGSTIYQTTDLNNFWDGTFKGERVQSGIYPYLLYVNENKIEGKIFVLY